MIRFSFKLAEKNQEPLIHKWVALDHIRLWVHGKGLQNLLEDLESFFAGGGTCKHWIAYDGKIPFAYLLTSEEDEDTVALDVFICDTDYLGKGYAAPMIRQFLLQHSDKKKVLIDPEATNTKAIHVYEKVGFRITGEFIAPWHPVPHYKMELAMKDLKAGYNPHDLTI